MYQVIKMYGDNEPWWFFDGWKQDVKEEKQFTDFESAKEYYEKCWQEFSEHNTYQNAKKNYLSAFWNPEDERWCEECDDYLQQYWGLALLKEGEALDVESEKELYETTNSSGETKCCKRLKQGA